MSPDTLILSTALVCDHLSLQRQAGDNFWAQAAVWRNSLPVLRDIHFHLPEGAVLGLVGRNGAGKSSLIRCLLGLTPPSAGHSQLLGCPSLQLDDATRERLGYVAQTPDLFGWLNGHEHLRELGAMYRHLDLDRALVLAARLALPLELRADRLSGGDQQKLAVVLAMAHDPDLLIMDEPVASLDPPARRDFLRALFAERSPGRDQRPRTVLLSSHVLSDLERVVSHVLFLAEGRVQLFDEWEALSEQLRLVRQPDAPGERPDLVHARVLDGQWQLLLDRRRCPDGLAEQGRALAMDDLFEELNA